MKKIKVITTGRVEMQKEIDKWFVDTETDTEKIIFHELISGGLNEYGYAICYIIYEKGMKL